MSVQFGKWNFDGNQVEQNYLEKVKAVIAPYGPDSDGSYAKTNISILFRAFHTTKESRREMQPYVTGAGAILTWDGRLDNREELVRESTDVVTATSTDVAIVAATYEKWGNACFAKLIGDWALSIWDSTTRSLILAKDSIGTRHLYYSFDHQQVTWSTILDPIVLFGRKTFALCEEYIAGWFSFFPAAHLTPYVGIHSVPPASSVLIRPGKHSVSRYWYFDGRKAIRYHTDAEYESHFRTVFCEAVRRRLRSDSPILAELSGGMDSSSIVCMADTIIAHASAETPRLDTISYYNDSEPNWNERPFFTKVEEKRGRTGCHIDVGKQEPLSLQLDSCGPFAATPGSGQSSSSESGKRYADCLASQGNRVILSGLGGDEITGGVPSPTSELQDLLARAHFRTLAHQLKVWALNKRKPWFYLLFEAARGFFPLPLVGVPRHKRPVPWLQAGFVKRNRRALQGYENTLRLFGPLPTFQENLSTLHVLQRQLACQALSQPLCEKRYPYLDRSLIEFMFAVPRTQLVRPGTRRSLMRRALVGIVPDEILDRKRKAFVARTPLAAISSDWASLSAMTQHMTSGALGIIDAHHFFETLQKAHQGQPVPAVSIMRTLGIESWLASLNKHRILVGVPEKTGWSLEECTPTTISAEKN